MNLIVFSISILAYFALHSLLAAKPISLWFQQNAISQKYYRLFFNMVALLGLLVLAYFYFLFEKQDLIKNTFVKWPGALLALTGLVWVVKALKGYHLGEFLGTYQMKKGTEPMHTGLVVSGLNAQVRHPLYFGTLLIVWGVFFVFPNDAALAIASISTIYLIVGTKLEERKLEQQFGEAYRSYKRQVPMLIPFRWSSSGK